MRPDLSIVTEEAIKAITTYLKDTMKREKRAGILLGMSGGLDSSVLAALAARAVGPERLHMAYLSDADSSKDIGANAHLMADWLGIDLELVPITQEMRVRGVYKPVFIKALRLSPIVAKISAGRYRVLCGETPFKSTLRIGAGERLRPWYKRLMFNMTMHHVDAGFSARHIWRREILEDMAKTRNLLLIGAANRSESEVGWFVKDGIDDLPIQPMTGLLKTQVRDLARALDLPAPVRDQLPSPDMAKGVSDEFGIGHEYALVDQVIDGFDRGLDVEEIAALGIPPKEIEDIRDLMRLSDWKRASPHETPPVTGEAGSDLRRAA